MKADILLELMGEMDESYVEEAACYPKRLRHRRRWGRLTGIAAACVMLVAGAFLLRMHDDPVLFEPTHLALSDASRNVTVFYATDIDLSKNDFSIADRIGYTAEEVFHDFDTAVFYGAVTGIREIEIRWRTEREYGALISFSVEDVYRGDIQPGDTVTVMVSPHQWVYSACCDYMGDLKVGTKGVFMPYILDETDVIQYGSNGVLVKKDLADYELDEMFMIVELDGQVRYIFSNDVSMPDDSMEQVLDFVNTLYPQEE